MTAATAMIPQDPPVLETSNRVLDPSSTSTMATPHSVAQDRVSAKRRRDELGDATVPTVGKNATMLLAEHRDARASVVHGVVAVAWTTWGGGSNPQIMSTDENLRVARPAIVLRAGRPTMVPCRDQRAIDHPRVASVLGAVLDAERGEPWGHRRDDPVHRGLRDRQCGGKLAHREVGSQRGTSDQDALRERA